MKISKKIEQKLDVIQQRCSARIIADFEIEHALNRYTQDLNIPKKSMVGIIIEDCDINAQNFPSCYRGIPESTHFSAEYKSSGWTITDVWRRRVSAPTKRIQAKLSESAKTALIAKFETY